MRTVFTIGLIALAGLVACGSDDNNEFGDTNSASPETVIRQWADALRAGDVRGAAEFFALPSVVANGTEPIILSTRTAARRFNAALPCGARLLRTSSAAGYTTAVFRLTERPGPGSCGTGTGSTARTTFVVRDGKIHEWRRVADEPRSTGPVV